MNTTCIYSYKVFEVTMHDCAYMFSLIGYHYIYDNYMEAVIYHICTIEIVTCIYTFTQTVKHPVKVVMSQIHKDINHLHMTSKMIKLRPLIKVINKCW